MPTPPPPARGLLAALLLLLSLAAAPILAAGAVAKDDEEAAQDRITRVPGFDGELPSRHYAGYVRVGGGGGDDERGGKSGGGSSNASPARNLFYYLVESERDPERDPVVLWLNGGPGCSSFDAFVYEHGPFLFSPNKNGGGNGANANDRLPTLSLNPFSWSKVATIIYLDSPGNVGLSYLDPEGPSPTSNGAARNHRPSAASSPSPSSSSPYYYSTNDTHTARDSDAFLRALLGERHPRLLDREFFVTGESYAGIYVPMLAREIARGNGAGLRPKINLRGYAVGNGCTDAEYDGNALPPFLAGRGLLPQDEYGELQEACGGSYWDADWAAAAAARADDGGSGSSNKKKNKKEGPSSRAECGRLLERAARVLDGINIYDVLDLCHASHRPHAEEGEGEGGGAAGALLLRPWAAATLGRPLSFSRDARVAALRPSFRLSSPSPPPPAAVLSAPNPPRLVGHNPPCTSATLAEDWLNDPRVRAALHAAPVGGEEGGFAWTLCSDRLHYTHDAGSMLPVHAELLPGLPGWPLMLARAGLAEEAGRAVAAARAANQSGSSGSSSSSSSGAPPPPPPLRALVYTGDHDAAVPSTGSEAWTRDVGGGRALPGRGWRRWQVEGGTDAGGRPSSGGDDDKPRQVAGFTVDYPGGLTYATVRGAGHMVPTSKPLEALELFRRFVDGEALAPDEREDGWGGEEDEEEEEEEAAAAAAF